MSGWSIFWDVLLSMLGSGVLFFGIAGYGSGWFERRLRPRRCQYCCNMIGKWARFVGVLNCDDCVSFMASGRAPRCRVPDCTGHDVG